MTDEPRTSEIERTGFCTRCRREYAWSLLEPVVTALQRIYILCPSCRMDRQIVGCAGDSGGEQP